MKRELASALAGAIVGAAITAAIFLSRHPAPPTNQQVAGIAIADSYVKLYDDPDYAGAVLTFLPAAARSTNGLRGDITDFAHIQPDNHDGSDFNDRASSITYLLPAGWTVILFEDADFKGKQLKLVGTGKVEKIPDLADTQPSFYDKASSLRWLQE
jgi:hypothetical protein